jgi:hypothetical protein
VAPLGRLANSARFAPHLEITSGRVAKRLLRGRVAKRLLRGRVAKHLLRGRVVESIVLWSVLCRTAPGSDGFALAYGE